eukprot:1542865-Pyramimonas_sp.AAC.1
MMQQLNLWRESKALYARCEVQERGSWQGPGGRGGNSLPQPGHASQLSQRGPPRHQVRSEGSSEVHARAVRARHGA